jgi:hypothetical protein
MSDDTIGLLVFRDPPKVPAEIRRRQVAKVLLTIIPLAAASWLTMRGLEAGDTSVKVDVAQMRAVLSAGETKLEELQTSLDRAKVLAVLKASQCRHGLSDDICDQLDIPQNLSTEELARLDRQDDEFLIEYAKMKAETGALIGWDQLFFIEAMGRKHEQIKKE